MNITPSRDVLTGFQNEKGQIGIISGRDSNVELLRIVCMLMIVIHHFLLHAFTVDIENPSAILTPKIAIATIINGFCYIGVNCFLLISGYYGIHCKLKSILNLFLMCAFYGLFGYLIHIYVDDGNIGRSLLFNSLFIFSHNSWWYVSCYVALMLFSPLLNIAIDHLEKRQFQRVLLLLSIFNLYFGWFWGGIDFNLNGYNIEQFIYVYIIGAYIRRYVSLGYIKCNRWRAIILYVLCAAIWGILTCLQHRLTLYKWNAFSYNNPFMIVASVAFFCFMISFSFKNRYFNWLATSALAVYLIQDNAFLRSYIYNFSKSLGNGNVSDVMLAIVLSVLFLFVVLHVDKIRIWLMRPIQKVILRIAEKYL